MTPFAAISSVPPQPSTCGLEAGKSTLLPLAPSLEPLSPEATVMVMPSAAADWAASSRAIIDCADQLDSGLPQLIEITDGGPLWVSCKAVVRASIKPCELLVVKYTAMLAPGAMAPATSISSATSPSASSGLLAGPGAFVAPSTETEVTRGSGIFRLRK